MKKNGFVFVETIVAVVVLTSSLLLLYSTFNDVLRMEKTRVYYDDISFIYRTYYLKETLNKLNIEPIKQTLLSDSYDDYFMTLGTGTGTLFPDDTYTIALGNIIEFFNVNQMILLNVNKLNNLKKCSSGCVFNSEDCDGGEPFESCNLLGTINEDFQKYLKTIDIDISCDTVLVVEYELNNHKFYSWVSV